MAIALIVGLGAGGGTERPSLPGVRPGVSIPPPAERPRAPTVTAPLLTGDGELGLDELRGQVVVLNFWASWCGPCRGEQPDLNAAHDELAGQDVAFLGVDLQDTRANGLAHWREFDVPYDSLFDPANEYAARFEGVGPRAIPSTILIDAQGRVAVRLFGATNETELEALVSQLVDERARAGGRPPR